MRRNLSYHDAGSVAGRPPYLTEILEYEWKKEDKTRRGCCGFF